MKLATNNFDKICLEGNEQSIYNYIQKYNISDDNIISKIKYFNNHTINIYLCDTLRNFLKNSISDIEYDKIINPYRLRHLCKNGDLMGVKSYISLYDLDFNNINDAIINTLFSEQPNIYIFQLLITHSVFNNCESMYFDNIVGIIITQNLVDFFKLMIEYTPNFMVKSTMIEDCCLYDCYEILLILMQHVENPCDFLNYNNEIILSCASCDNCFLDLFIDLGINLDNENNFKQAVILNFKYYVEKYFEQGYWPKEDIYVMIATRAYSTDVLDILLSHNLSYDIGEIEQYVNQLRPDKFKNDIIVILNKHNIRINN
ncbi:hypothetical protein [Powai lake megavirus]|uniref:Ankyrin repeat protein n=1 Tax=Powai lake megavirus TaxID=1842663 RepID=A0A167RIE4_9VIRU|nr:hypothetical protein QJ849_gp559 [Powai lake megavirus]ANB50721.1 hypothetical protein [Powai lake megavirus]